MATYEEISQMYAVGALKPKIAVAVASAAETILSENTATPNHTARYLWAAKAMKDPYDEADKFLIGVLVANKAASVAVIEGATDTQIQNNVDALVDVFALANI